MESGARGRPCFCQAVRHVICVSSHVSGISGSQILISRCWYFRWRALIIDPHCGSVHNRRQNNEQRTVKGGYVEALIAIDQFMKSQAPVKVGKST